MLQQPPAASSPPRCAACRPAAWHPSEVHSGPRRGPTFLNSRLPRQSYFCCAAACRGLLTYRSNPGGTCPTRCGGGAGHQRYRVQPGASCACQCGHGPCTHAPASCASCGRRSAVKHNTRGSETGALARFRDAPCAQRWLALAPRLAQHRIQARPEPLRATIRPPAGGAPRRPAGAVLHRPPRRAAPPSPLRPHRRKPAGATKPTAARRSQLRRRGACPRRRRYCKHDTGRARGEQTLSGVRRTMANGAAKGCAGTSAGTLTPEYRRVDPMTEREKTTAQ